MFNISTQVMLVKETSAKLTHPHDVYEEIKDAGNMAQEAFFVITLDRHNNMIDKHMITLGILDAALVHPREVFRAAISDGACAIIIAHNHPSGDTTPSAEDLKITRTLVEAGKIVDIKILDHMIVSRGDNPYISLRESGLVSF